MRAHQDHLVQVLGDDLAAFLEGARAAELQPEAGTRVVDALSLDIDGQSGIKGKEEWTRQQKRVYHRVNSVLSYWEGNQFQVLWLMLSTAVGGDASKLTYNHKRLRQKVEREFGYRGMEHFQVRTDEGNGVLHVFWAWKAKPGMRQLNFGVPYKWLEREWKRIHGASVVYIKRYGRYGRGRDRRWVSRYVASQYCTDHVALVNYSWSWKKTFGFPLVAVWKQFRALYVGPLRCAGVKAWTALLRGETVMRGDGGRMSIEGMRFRYAN